MPDLLNQEKGSENIFAPRNGLVKQGLIQQYIDID